MSYQQRANSLLGDYANIRSLPAMLSVAYILASLYQFGGISTVDLVWIDYQLTTDHSLLVSLGAYAAAFASSETKRFENYETWEQALIAAGPAVILGYEYVPELHDIIVSIGDPLGMQLAFLLTVVSWGVAVR
ncbi:hypothetical protein [Halorarius halobius]|uniref:hypothetical protein n=1 Tax=Halorarius halobius TaxID=2962671 RepID=UPI0020CB7A0A|nr:hypothetical protein [Halorarius halobius]